MKKEDLVKKLEDLKEVNRQREAQVTEWVNQKEQLSANIQKAKEDHDYTRGQIATYTEILSASEKEPQPNEHKS